MVNSQWSSINNKPTISPGFECEGKVCMHECVYEGI